MITLYTWDTPNGRKPAILLEELALDYKIAAVNLRDGAQRADAFLRLSPNGKIPALDDGDVTLFESGAILLYLAEKHGAFLAASGPARADALGWTFWQVGGLGPMVGQFGYFARAKERNAPAIERYLAESLRLFEVLERRFAQARYLAGPEYSIADMMSYPWISAGLDFLAPAAGERMPALSATRAWAAQIGERPAVQRALARVKAAAA